MFMNNSIANLEFRIEAESCWTWHWAHLINPQDFGSFTTPNSLHWPLGTGEGVIGGPFSGVQVSSSVFSVPGTLVSGTVVSVEPFGTVVLVKSPETVVLVEPFGTVALAEVPLVPRKSSVSILQTMAPPRPIFLAN
ncbi:Protein of unknown function [Cotesia congregata]|uniref:Uncharacterized protein n=1 Tax=Cotesia congregata TaxID=51543 RepID=A0A8J2H9V9_COTCN|nr:Protein of unknown function [Cotesia congregata]